MGGHLRLWIRSVHRLSAHLMVAAVFLHLVRVFLTGAYKNGAGRGQRREWNWVMGVAMLLLTLFLSFTGYLLPWDQLASWAVTVGTNIAASVPYAGPRVRELLIGGRNIEQATLLRFYVLHVNLPSRAAGRSLRCSQPVADPQGRGPRPRGPRGRRCARRRPRSRSARRPTRSSAWPGARARHDPRREPRGRATSP